MNKIKIGAQVTAKVCPTKVTVSGTFQGYELQDKEDPTSVCGKVFYVKDGMQHLDYVYVDSIKVCKGEDEDERIRKEIVELIKNNYGCLRTTRDKELALAWLEKQKEQKPASTCRNCQFSQQRARYDYTLCCAKRIVSKYYKKVVRPTETCELFERKEDK